MTDLHRQLALLYEVQQLDVKAIGIHRHTQSVPQEIKKLETELEDFGQRVEAKKIEIQESEKKQRSISGELELLTEQRNKLTMQMRSVKTNKEYEALDKEIEFLDQKEMELEDTILELLERVDQLNEELKEATVELERQQTEQLNRKKEYAAERTELTKNMRSMGQQRKEICQHLDHKILSQYENWVKRRQDTFVAPMRDGACGHCQMKLPPQLAGEIPNTQEILRCPVCRRVLFSSPVTNGVVSGR